MLHWMCDPSVQYDLSNNMLHWMCDPSVQYDLSNNMFVLNKPKDKIINSAPVQSPQQLCSSKLNI